MKRSVTPPAGSVTGRVSLIRLGCDGYTTSARRWPAAGTTTSAGADCPGTAATTRTPPGTAATGGAPPLTGGVPQADSPTKDTAMGTRSFMATPPNR
ncbi:hypothetical protein D3C72_868620 [compost metagenome]